MFLLYQTVWRNLRKLNRKSVLTAVYGYDNICVYYTEKVL
jgi:hypothetical protein